MGTRPEAAFDAPVFLPSAGIPPPAAKLRSALRFDWVIAAGAAAIFLSLALWPISRDEGQYVAATALMRTGLPYRDFAYLQTPLQPLLLAPLAWLPAGALLVVSRLFNGLCAFATLLLVSSAARRITPSSLAALSVIALALSEPFLLAGSLARNDALPMALLAGAVAVMCRTLRESSRNPRPWLAVGLLMGLAVSAKINFALPAAGAGVFLILRTRRGDWRPLGYCFLGGLLGLLPTLVLAAAEPHRFVFDVFTYSLTAPQQFLHLTHHRGRLWPPRKLFELTQLALSSLIIAGLVAAVADRCSGKVERLLDLMIVGGLIGAYLPDPAYSQYLVPLLPCVAVRLAAALGRVRGGARTAVRALVLVGCGLGAAHIGIDLDHAITRSWPLRDANRQGRTVAQLADGRPVATLSPELIAGHDVVLDRGFATGPFLYRTEGKLADDSNGLGFSPGWQQLDSYFALHPPGAILAGAELRPFPPVHPKGLDAPLVRWAEAHHYRPLTLPGRDMTLFLRP